jgi:hypothetical protein
MTATDPHIRPVTHLRYEITPAALELADRLHNSVCNCQDRAGHERAAGDSYAALADRLIGEVRNELAPTIDYPVEPKVKAATWGTLAATIALALVTALLDRLDVIPDLVAGRYPWAGILVMVLGIVLPPVAAFIRGWQAEHQARPMDNARGVGT